jgi:predicted transcriptional regulator YheO
MSAQTPSEVKATILVHRHHGLSGQKIFKQLKSKGIFSSKITINLVVGTLSGANRRHQTLETAGNSVLTGEAH